MATDSICNGDLSRKFLRMIAIRNRAIREFLAETIGTFVLVFFATASACQQNLIPSSSNPTTSHLSASMGVMLAITVSGGVSGGGCNPAISLAFCLTNRTPWRLYPVHVIGQFLGSFLAAGTVFAVYTEALQEFDKGVRSVDGPTGSAAMFVSMPRPFLTTESGFLDQVVGSGFLVLGVNAVLDERNMNSHKGLKPLLLGFVFFAIGGAIGSNCGYPINPARDLGPRVFLAVAGWGTDMFSFRDYNWFWIPIAGPITGSIVATTIYYAMVAWHWPDDDITNNDKTDRPDTDTSTDTYSTDSIQKENYKNDAKAADDSILGDQKSPALVVQRL